MNTKLFLIVLLLTSISFYGQDKITEDDKESNEGGKSEKTLNTTVFTLNLSKPSGRSLTSSVEGRRLTIRSRDLLQFDLKGGNPFKYNYYVNSQPINFFENSAENNPLKKIENIISQSTPKPEETVDETNNKTDQKIIDISTALNTIKYSPSLYEKSKIIDLTSEKTATPTYGTEQQKITILTAKLNELVNEKATYDFSARHSYDFLSNMYELEKPKSIEEDKKIVYKAAIELKNKAEKLLTEISSFKLKVTSEENLEKEDFSKSTHEFIEKLQKLADDYNGIKTDAAFFDKVDAKYPGLENEIKTKLTSIIDELSNFCNVKFDNFTLPLDINGKNIDIVEVTLERVSKEKEASKNIYKYNIWVKGGLKIDISGGIYITSLVNKEYYTENRTDTVNSIAVQRKVIFEKKKGNYELGFGSSINISYRSAGWVNPTLNIGALFTVNQQFQILLGPGLILGKEERVILSSGLSMGKITRISDAYSANGKTLYDLGENGTIQTDNKFAFGYYFGITYNLSKNKKQAQKTQ